MNPFFGTNTLGGYLKRIESAFDIDEILQQEIGLAEIEDYYFQSNWGYLLFHSFDGALHMALSEKGKFRYKDYLAQINVVAEEIQAIDAQEILELGTGKGFNLHRLAQKFPERKFSGMDLSPLHVAQSRRKLGSLRNTDIIRADFHHLPYPEQSFDYVFEFESVCHALDLRQVLKNAHRVLRNGGRITFFDGFRILPMDQLNQEEKTARFLIEKTLGIHKGIFIEDFQHTAIECGFKIVSCEDLSSNILPNLKRFETILNIFLPTVTQLRIARRLFPKYFVNNAIAGLLMPILVEAGVQGYFRLTLERS